MHNPRDAKAIFCVLFRFFYAYGKNLTFCYHILRPLFPFSFIFIFYFVFHTYPIISISFLFFSLFPLFLPFFPFSPLFSPLSLNRGTIKKREKRYQKVSIIINRAREKSRVTKNGQERPTGVNTQQAIAECSPR